jgi:hypothetical protein
MSCNVTKGVLDANTKGKKNLIRKESLMKEQMLKVLFIQKVKLLMLSLIRILLKGEFLKRKKQEQLKFVN